MIISILLLVKSNIDFKDYTDMNLLFQIINRKTLHYILCITILIVFIFKPEVSLSDIIVTDSLTNQSIGKDLYIFEDKSGLKTCKDILDMNDFEKSKIDVPFFDFTESVIWVKFHINSQSQKKLWYLKLSYPLMDFIDVCYIKKNKIYKIIKTGYKTPFKTRLVKNRNFIFPISLVKNEKVTILMRFKNKDRMEIPLHLLSYQHFYEIDHDDQYVMGAYLGIIIFLIFFNMIFFIAMRNKIYIFYVFFLLSFSVFWLTQTGHVYEYFTISFLGNYNHSVTLTISLTLFFTILFSQTYLNTALYTPRLHDIMKISKYIILLVPLVHLISYSLSIQLMVAIVIISLPFLLFTSSLILLKGFKPARLYLLSWTAILVGGVVYALKIAGFLPATFVVNNALQFGSTIQFLLLSFGLADRMRIIEIEKEEAKNKAHITENRYQSLFDGSNDLIFTLDRDWNFITINRAIKKHFKVIPSVVIGTKIIDYIYEDAGNKGMAKRLLLKKLSEFLETKEAIDFRVKFRSPYINEPKEYHVNLQYIIYQDSEEILGRANIVAKDVLVPFIESEHRVYKIDNLLTVSEDVAIGISQSAAKFFDTQSVNLIRLALRELIINAIEHGNLAITYEEKTNAINNETYFSLIERRRNDVQYKDKKVTVEYYLKDDYIQYVITDEGAGFNFDKIQLKRLAAESSIPDAHGRGITMAESVFDELTYKKPGNVVVLKKYFINDD